jgi:hypothetical protein
VDIKELAKEIHARFDRVSSRLAALNKEREQLETEHDSLLKLVVLYDSIKYDSITEELRVTENILKPKITKKIYKNKGKSQYDEPLEVIMTSAAEPMTFGDIHRSLCELTGKTIHAKNMNQILYQQMNKGNVVRVAYGKYGWRVEEDNEE